MSGRPDAAAGSRTRRPDSRTAAGVVVASREMAIFPPRAPRHIIYKVALLIVSSAPAACTEREAADPEVREPARAPVTTSAAPSAPANPVQPPNPAQNTPGDETPAPPDQTAPDTSGFHLDDPEIEYEIPRRSNRSRKGPPIQIVLRSSPPGAVAAVDGVTIGPTPSLWEGMADTATREFTFVLPGYAIARYRFVPTRSGIVHGTLESIKAEDEPADRGRHRRRANRPAPPDAK